MIVRMWHGRVPANKAQEYRKFLNERALPDYQSVPGNISVHILERREGEVTHFITMSSGRTEKRSKALQEMMEKRQNTILKTRHSSWSSNPQLSIMRSSVTHEMFPKTRYLPQEWM